MTTNRHNKEISITREEYRSLSGWGRFRLFFQAALFGYAILEEPTNSEYQP